MRKIIIHHRTDDFNSWKSVCESLEPVGRKYGSTGGAVFRGVAEPNERVVITR